MVITISGLVTAIKQIKKLQLLIGKKAMHNRPIKEAIEYGREKSVECSTPYQKRVENKFNEPKVTCVTGAVMFVVKRCKNGECPPINDALNGVDYRTHRQH